MTAMKNNEYVRSLKERHLNELAEYHDGLVRKPRLKRLFLELTLRCNAHCFHCGSNCTPLAGDELSLNEYKTILEQVREDFFEIMGYAHKLGFHWGMTSNATLISKECAKRLAECGMSTISVSIDGLRETHDALRGMKGGYDLAMAGIRNLIEEGAFQAVQVTSVFNHQNIKELDAMFDIMDGLDIDSWRVINLEPIGRALLRPDLMCTKEDYIRLFEFIREKREAGYPLLYGCSHYLGLDYEAEVREWYWLCNAGVYTASIMANGDIAACLDIERRPELIQGNIRKDRLKDVWENRFRIFREDLSEKCGDCRGCEHRRFCRGDAYHSWDYENSRPMVCMKGILF